MKIILKSLPIAGFFMAVSSLLPTQAQLLTYDGFAYTPGTSLIDRAGGFGWTDAWTTGLSGGGFGILGSSLAPPVPGFVSSGGSVSEHLTPPHGHNWTIRPMNPITTAVGDSLWLSSVLNVGGPVTDGSWIAVIFDFASPSIGLEIIMSARTRGTGGPFKWGLDAYNSVIGPDASPGDSAILVTHMTHSAPWQFDFEFFVNPPTGPGVLPPAPTGTLTYFGGGWDTLYRATLVMREPGMSGGFDEIRIGRDYASVTMSTAYSSVPEPSGGIKLTGALLVGAGMVHRVMRTRNS